MATVPISDGDPKDTYTATGGQTTFPYTFWVKEQDHIAVYVNGILKTLTTDYTVSAVQEPAGANIVFNSGLNDGDSVVIVYAPEFERLTEYTGTIRLEALNTEQTYHTTLFQDLNRKVGDALRIADSEAVTFSGTLPTLTGNGGRVLALKSDLSGVEYVSIASSDVIVSNYAEGVFSGTGAQTDFTLPFTPAVQNGLLVWVGGVRQRPGTDYTVSGPILTFASAPASGSDNIEYLNTAASTSANVPTDGSVTTDKIADGAVTQVKLASDSVSTVKLVNSAVTNAKLATGDTVLKDNIDDDLISTYTDTAIAAGDEILFSDVSDSSNMKKDTVQGILDLVVVSSATTSAEGVVEKATSAEMIAGTTDKFPDAEVVKDYLDEYVTTPWVQYTPTFASLGTVSSVSMFSRRVGDSLHIRGFLTAGTVAGTPATMTIGYNGTNSNVTIDTAKLGTGENVIGQGGRGNSGQPVSNLANPLDTGVIKWSNGASGCFTVANGSNFNNNEKIAVNCIVPISGW